MNLWPEISLVLVAYLVGSIPFGYILTKKFTGKSILGLGSGNIGSTNVGRIAGKKIAALTQLLDMLKGFLPVALVYLLQVMNIFHFEEIYIYIVAFATILGHDFSVFLKFRGGKGVNTTLGASLLLAPFSVFISVFFYFVVKWKYKTVSLGSIVLSILLPVSDLLVNEITFQFYYLSACAVLIVVLHIPNIKRLLNGNENRVQ